VGKNFSANNLGQRLKSDFYKTPSSITQQFLDTGELDFNKEVLDPCCGTLEMTNVLVKNFKARVHYYDINQDADFFEETNKYPYGCMNPPFSKSFAFIQKSKEVFTDKFAMLLPLSYLHGVNRYEHIWQDKTFPLKAVYVFTRYPMLSGTVRPDGKYPTGMVVYAWYVWDKSWCGEPLIRWINNQQYIVSKKDL